MVYTTGYNREFFDETSEGGIQTEYDDNTMKTKLLGRSNNIRFDDKSLCSNMLGFTLHWDYERNIEYINQTITILSTLDKIQLKCDVVDGCVVIGLGQTLQYSFLLDKPSGYRVFCEPETAHLRKTNSSVLNTITCSLEDYDHKEFNFNRKALIFALQ